MSQQTQVTVMQQICNTIDTMKSGIEERLEGTGVNAARFISTAKTAIQSHNDRASLEKADRQSLFLAIQKAASDGLLPDNREAALVVYNINIAKKGEPDKWIKQVQYQPMVQGLVKLARKSGEIGKISASVVYEKDDFKFNPATMDLPDFNPNWFGDRGKPIGVWAMIKLKDGNFLNEMITEEQIKRKSTASKVPKNYEITARDFEEWWKKLAIRNVLKYAPRTTALDQALEKDNEEFDFGNDESGDINNIPSSPVPETVRTETRAAAAVKKAKMPEPKKEEPSVEESEDHEVIEAEYTETTDDEDDIPV